MNSDLGTIRYYNYGTMPTKIGPRKTLRHYIAEHLDSRGLTQRQLADRLGCDEMTVSRWINYKVRTSPETLAAIAEAIGDGSLEWQDLLHDPENPSVDSLMRQLPESDRDHFLRSMKALIREK